MFLSMESDPLECKQWCSLSNLSADRCIIDESSTHFRLLKVGYESFIGNPTIIDMRLKSATIVPVPIP